LPVMMSLWYSASSSLILMLTLGWPSTRAMMPQLSLSQALKSWPPRAYGAPFFMQARLSAAAPAVTAESRTVSSPTAF
jgi:hypothetical protein